MQQDMSNLTPSSETGQSVDLLSMPRSPQWPEVQRACLEKNNYTCVACGIQGEGKVQVHHIIPFQYCVVYGRPELEFNPKNLIPLSLTERITRSAKFLCSYSKLSKHQIQSEVKKAQAILEKNGFRCDYSVTEDDAMDKGCSFLVFSHDNNSIIGSDAIYEKSLNGIGEFVANKFVETNHGVDLFLSDMLVVPLSLIKDTSVFRVKQITKHLETNLFVASKMTCCKYGIGKLDDGFEVRIRGISDSRMQ